jgi:chromate transporter
MSATVKPGVTLAADGSAAAHGVSFAEAFKVWLRVALLSFGGPAGQIAVMHRIVVEERRWISEARFLHALNYCHLLPGPEAQQLAIYIGWLMHKTRGGLAAGVLFVVPGVVALMALSWIYVIWAMSASSPACSLVSRRPCSPSSSRPCCGSAAAP